MAASMIEELPEAVAKGDEAAVALAAEAQALAWEFQEVVERQSDVDAARLALAVREERLTSRFLSVREELEVSRGGGQGMAQVLLDVERRYPDHVEFVNGLLAGVESLDAARFLALQVRIKQRSQSELEQQFAGHPSDVVAQLVMTRADLLERLRDEYAKLTRDLAALESDRRRFLDQAQALYAFAEQQLVGFGMRSFAPLRLEQLSELPAGLGWFFAREHWVGLARAVRNYAVREPLPAALFALLLAGLLLGRQRISRALERTGEKTRKVSKDRFGYTLKALSLDLVARCSVAVGACSGCHSRWSFRSRWSSSHGSAT